MSEHASPASGRSEGGVRTRDEAQAAGGWGSSNSENTPPGKVARTNSPMVTDPTGAQVQNSAQNVHVLEKNESPRQWMDPQFVDCPALTAHELTVRFLEMNDRMGKMDDSMKEEVSAMEKRVAIEYDQWADYLSDTLDKLIERVGDFENLKNSIRQENQELTERSQFISRVAELIDERVSCVEKRSEEKAREQQRENERMVEVMQKMETRMMDMVGVMQKMKKRVMESTHIPPNEDPQEKKSGWI